jgi:hypothetical protein
MQRIWSHIWTFSGFADSFKISRLEKYLGFYEYSNSQRDTTNRQNAALGECTRTSLI